MINIFFFEFIVNFFIENLFIKKSKEWVVWSILFFYYISYFLVKEKIIWFFDDCNFNKDNGNSLYISWGK